MVWHLLRAALECVTAAASGPNERFAVRADYVHCSCHAIDSQESCLAVSCVCKNFRRTSGSATDIGKVPVAHIA